ncbi:hypothetical protein F442_17985 [Phytophthora nicotianae P10297]|uniref:Crinkler effector protein N-terminal domain-containing protein n=1 Tax=Phytophthora nicotianae P10297 TaxID=1317064 RepID=W2YFA9_PHYNI|nr:hypothetical protein F442_17985 [Phytophthora nicotianae P10297]
MVKLFCAVVGGKRVPCGHRRRPVVGDLKEAIKAENPDTINGTSDLKLLGAARARLRRVGLSDRDVGGVDEEEEAEGRGPVNVLVVVPEGVAGAVASVEPSAAPTTIHRHPERL